MRTKFYFVAALAATMLASCADDKFVGDNSPNVVEQEATNTEGMINFGSGFKAVTRASEHVGADAASLLNKRFYVGGFKTDGTTWSTVFKDYAVEWTENTAGKTESNTSDWEYVGVTPLSPKNTTTGFAQTIKYWDYSTSSYDFIAFATGNGHNDAGTKDVADTYATGKIAVSTIDHANLGTAAYTLKGDRADLLNCYIADMKTVNKVDYGNEVQLAFRALASKVRVALYETVPGYSVKDVKFYTKDVDADNLGKDPRTNAATTGTAALIGDFSNKATFTVKFTSNVAHVDIASDANDEYQTFGTLNYTTADNLESAGSYYLGRSSNLATYAGTESPDHYYVKVLPNENGGVMELAVDYTLVSTDGSGEEINVYGATAYVPLTYTKWLANYAYTYIFKISDNSNGWTSKVKNDPTGLFPITFDAIVIDSEENTQSTITTVASPSITTYQKGHDLNKNEYAATGNIYVQVMVGGAVKNDVAANGKLYTVTSTLSPATPISEASVMDALNIVESGTTGRNGIALTEETLTATTTIPGEDGNNITVNTGEAAVFTPTANTTYAYVYDTQTWNGIAVTLTGADAPTGWPSGYYEDPACTVVPSSYTQNTTYYQRESYIYTATTWPETTAPSDWSTAWFKDPDGLTPVDAWVAANQNQVFYKRYTVNGKIYGVKVIKVVP